MLSASSHNISTQPTAAKIPTIMLVSVMLLARWPLSRHQQSAHCSAETLGREWLVTHELPLTLPRPHFLFWAGLHSSLFFLCLWRAKFGSHDYSIFILLEICEQLSIKTRLCKDEDYCVVWHDEMQFARQEPRVRRKRLPLSSSIRVEREVV
jgi:hypothetical protein